MAESETTQNGGAARGDGDDGNALLTTLAAQGAIDEASAARAMARLDAASTPWWLSVILALAAWLAATLVLLAVLKLKHDLTAPARVVIAVLCLGVALPVLRKSTHVFGQQFGLALSLAGQGLMAWVFVDESSVRLGFALSAALAAVLTVPRAPVLHRGLCALAAWLCLLVSLGAYLVDVHHIHPGAVSALGVLVGALALALWLRRAHWTQWWLAGGDDAGLPKAWAGASAVMSMLLAVGVASLDGVDALGFGLHPGRQESLVFFYRLYRWGAAALLLAVCAHLLRPLAPARRWPLLGVAALCAAVGWQWSGMLMVAALALAAFQACQRVWFAVLLLWLVPVVGCYYYNLSSSLLVKSISMMALGAVLLALRWALARWRAQGDAQ
ncbi:MAG: DUF4401 domain-containing protein [Burkholderiaceae bacterium]|jgi:hypothetical protein|nr:DUF4401 domain-containing protein [Burkholderiaceae bacterium]